MASALDILKELEDIGAVGNKIQPPLIRRLPPVLPDPVVEAIVAKALDTVSEPEAALPGFVEHLEALESALRGMLTWCDETRTRLTASAPEESPAEVETTEVEEAHEAEAEEAADDLSAAEASEELPAEPLEETIVPVDPNDPVQLASPGVPVIEPHRRSLAELKALFMLPDALLLSKPNGNGAGKPVTGPPQKSERSDG